MYRVTFHSSVFNITQFLASDCNFQLLTGTGESARRQKNRLLVSAEINGLLINKLSVIEVLKFLF